MQEKHGSGDEIEFGAELVFEEALVAEVQGNFLVGEEQKRGRRGFCLRDVVDAHGARLRRAAALEIDFLREPIIQHGRGNAASAGGRAVIEWREEVFGAVTRSCGRKNSWAVNEELHFRRK